MVTENFTDKWTRRQWRPLLAFATARGLGVEILEDGLRLVSPAQGIFNRERKGAKEMRRIASMAEMATLVAEYDDAS